MKLLYISNQNFFLSFGAVVALAAILFILYVRSSRAAAKRTEQLRQQYLTTLKNGDKQAALQAGRMYYQSRRGGRLTIYDEQALTNDLAAMK